MIVCSLFISQISFPSQPISHTLIIRFVTWNRLDLFFGEYPTFDNMNFGNLLNWLSQTVSIKLEMISVAVLLTSGMVIGFTYSGFILLINLCMCPVLSTLAPVFAINTSGHIRISTNIPHTHYSLRDMEQVRLVLWWIPHLW